MATLLFNSIVYTIDVEYSDLEICFTCFLCKVCVNFSLYILKRKYCLI